MMRINGPERYRLQFDSTDFQVTCAKGTSKFSGIAISKKPKLYIASVDEVPIYVGVTKQPIRNRLRFGRHALSEAYLDIWSHEDAPADNSTSEIETIEAEVVFLIRSSGQWPRFQTEIHFHPSTSLHREAAASIVRMYSRNAVG